MAKFEVTIAYKDKRKKNWTKTIETEEGEFIVDLYEDETYIKIKRVE